MSTALLAIAKGYPYEAPSHSFIFRDGRDDGWPDESDGPALVERWRSEGRVPVLAYGANRSASALARKFDGWPAGTTIPVTQAWLNDHDIVYSAHLSRYGSAPAKIERIDGVRVEVGVIWLTAQQLDRMHETEGKDNYRFDKLHRLDLTLQALDVGLDRLFAYVGRRPNLHINGQPIPIAAVRADTRIKSVRMGWS